MFTTSASRQYCRIMEVADLNEAKAPIPAVKENSANNTPTQDLKREELREIRLLRSKSRLTNNAAGKVTTSTTCGSVACNAPIRCVGWVGPFGKLKGHHVQVAKTYHHNLQRRS